MQFTGSQLSLAKREKKSGEREAKSSGLHLLSLNTLSINTHGVAKTSFAVILKERYRVFPSSVTYFSKQHSTTLFFDQATG